jgi:hypothetical protein
MLEHGSWPQRGSWCAEGSKEGPGDWGTEAVSFEQSDSFVLMHASAQEG